VDQLRINLAFDVRPSIWAAVVGVAPRTATAVLTLIAPEPDSDEYKTDRSTDFGRVCGEDVVATYSQWRKRGVRFRMFHVYGGSSISSVQATC